MSQKRKRLFLPTLISVTVAAMAIFLFVVYPRAASREHSKPDSSLMANNPSALQSQSQPRYRNLSLQPEAFNLSRKLGRRFGATNSEVSIITGTLQIGAQSQPVQITRRQSERGERLEIALGTLLFTWSETEGAKSGGSRASGAVRLLIERLAFDSADQFVLAQLRGASYYTIARGVRPDDAGDAGPVWTVVRVDDPDRDEQRRPQSRWRLYYLNSSTNLIDKVVSEIQGQRVEANFSQWTEVEVERVPFRITWTSEGQTLMEFQLLSFTRSGL